MSNVIQFEYFIVESKQPAGLMNKMDKAAKDGWEADGPLVGVHDGFGTIVLYQKFRRPVRK